MLRCVVLVLIALGVAGCAAFGPSGASKSRQQAIAACVEAVPAETVPFAETFAACMESYGWAYKSTSGASH